MPTKRYSHPIVLPSGETRNIDLEQDDVTGQFFLPAGGRRIPLPYNPSRPGALTLEAQKILEDAYSKGGPVLEGESKLKAPVPKQAAPSTTATARDTAMPTPFTQPKAAPPSRFELPEITVTGERPAFGEPITPEEYARLGITQPIPGINEPPQELESRRQALAQQYDEQGRLIPGTGIEGLLTNPIFAGPLATTFGLAPTGREPMERFLRGLEGFTEFGRYKAAMGEEPGTPGYAGIQTERIAPGPFAGLWSQLTGKELRQSLSDMLIGGAHTAFGLGMATTPTGALIGGAMGLPEQVPNEDFRNMYHHLMAPFDNSSPSGEVANLVWQGMLIGPLAKRMHGAPSVERAERYRFTTPEMREAAFREGAFKKTRLSEREVAGIAEEARALGAFAEPAREKTIIRAVQRKREEKRQLFRQLGKLQEALAKAPMEGEPSLAASSLGIGEELVKRFAKSGIALRYGGTQRGDWDQYETEAGNFFYVNRNTGEFVDRLPMPDLSKMSPRARDHYYRLADDAMFASTSPFFRAVATKIGDKVYEGLPGWAHFDLHDKIAGEHGVGIENVYRELNAIDGFVDQKGRFYNRMEASEAVTAAKRAELPPEVESLQGETFTLRARGELEGSPKAVEDAQYWARYIPESRGGFAKAERGIIEPGKGGVPPPKAIPPEGGYVSPKTGLTSSIFRTLKKEGLPPGEGSIQSKFGGLIGDPTIRAMGERILEHLKDRGIIQTKKDEQYARERAAEDAQNLDVVGASVIFSGAKSFGEFTKVITDRIGQKAVDLLNENPKTNMETLYKSSRNWLKKFQDQSRPISLRKEVEGEYVAPGFKKGKGILSPEKVQEVYELGKDGQEFYNNRLPAFEQLFGNDADMVLRFIAATSPNNVVKSNATLALKAYKLYKTGVFEPGKQYTWENLPGKFVKAHRQLLSGALAGTSDWGGLKVQSFIKNFYDTPSGRDAVTIDVWMGRTFLGVDNPNPNQYAFMRDQVRELARKAGVDPREYQAGVWRGIKLLAEGPQEHVLYEQLLADKIGAGYLDEMLANMPESVPANVGANFQKMREQWVRNQELLKQRKAEIREQAKAIRARAIELSGHGLQSSPDVQAITYGVLPVKDLVMKLTDLVRNLPPVFNIDELRRRAQGQVSKAELSLIGDIEPGTKVSREQVQASIADNTIKLGSILLDRKEKRVEIARQDRPTRAPSGRGGWKKIDVMQLTSEARDKHMTKESIKRDFDKMMNLGRERTYSETFPLATKAANIASEFLRKVDAKSFATPDAFMEEASAVRAKLFELAEEGNKKQHDIIREFNSIPQFVTDVFGGLQRMSETQPAEVLKWVGVELRAVGRHGRQPLEALEAIEDSYKQMISDFRVTNKYTRSRGEDWWSAFNEAIHDLTIGMKEAREGIEKIPGVFKKTGESEKFLSQRRRRQEVARRANRLIEGESKPRQMYEDWGTFEDTRIGTADPSYEEFVLTAPLHGRSSHFRVAGDEYLAHALTKTREVSGKKYLHIEEAQSDFVQMLLSEGKEVPGQAGKATEQMVRLLMLRAYQEGYDGVIWNTPEMLMDRYYPDRIKNAEVRSEAALVRAGGTSIMRREFPVLDVGPPKGIGYDIRVFPESDYGNSQGAGAWMNWNEFVAKPRQEFVDSWVKEMEKTSEIFGDPKIKARAKNELGELWDKFHRGDFTAERGWGLSEESGIHHEERANVFNGPTEKIAELHRGIYTVYEKVYNQMIPKEGKRIGKPVSVKSEWPLRLKAGKEYGEFPGIEFEVPPAERAAKPKTMPMFAKTGGAAEYFVSQMLEYMGEKPIVPAYKEVEDKYAGSINKLRMELTERGKEELDRLVAEIEDVKGEPLTDAEVIQAARSAALTTRVLDRADTEREAAQVLALRQAVAAAVEGRASAVETELMVKSLNSLAAHYGRMLQKFSVGAEGIPRDLAFELLRQIEKKGGNLKAAIEKSKKVDFNDPIAVQKFYREFVAPTVSEIMAEFRYINMLSSPRTHMINTFSNLIQAGGMHPFGRLMEAVADPVAAMLQGREREVYLREVPTYFRGMMMGLGKATEAGLAGLRGIGEIGRPDIQHFGTFGQAPALGNRWYHRITEKFFGGISKYNYAFRSVLNALEASDRFFRTLIEEGEVAALMSRAKAQGVNVTDKVYKKILVDARRRASESVFRDNKDALAQQTGVLKWINGTTNAMKSWRAKHPSIRWFLPFIETPMNILKRGIEYSPLGFVAHGKGLNPEKFGKAMAGSLVMAGTAKVMADAETTWALPRTKKERDTWEAEGKIPYAIKLGDTWYSYSKLGPIGYPMALVAAVKATFEEDRGGEMTTSEKIQDALNTYVAFFADQSYVRGLQEVTELLSGERGAISQAAIGTTRQYVPLGAAVNWANAFVDQIKRKPSRELGEDVWDRIKMGIPGASMTLAPKVGITGETVPKPDLVSNFLNLSPVYASKAKGTPIIKALREKGVNIAMPSQKVFGRDLDPFAYEMYSREVGARVMRELENEVTKEWWDRATPEEAQQEVDYLVTQVRKSVREELFSEWQREYEEAQKEASR